jgi:phosphate acyltransferase
MPDNERVNIAVDAMGGDGGCRVVVEGAVRALSDDEGLVLHLVGNRSDLESALSSVDARLRGRIRLHDADSVLPMDVSTARALRQGQGSSMQLSLELLVAGEVSGGCQRRQYRRADGIVSRQVLGMLPGIERPALMAAVPGAGKLVWILDLGANVGVDAHRLLEFARLGDIASRSLTGTNTTDRLAEYRA